MAMSQALVQQFVKCQMVVIGAMLARAKQKSMQVIVMRSEVLETGVVIVAVLQLGIIKSVRKHLQNKPAFTKLVCFVQDFTKNNLDK